MDITKALNKMTNDHKKNIKILKKTKYDFNELLYTLANEVYNDKLSLLAIESILKSGVDINKKLDEDNPNFLFEYFNNNHFYDYNIEVCKLAIKYGLNVNAKDNYNNTLIHKLIELEYGNNIILNIYKLFVENGYDIFILNDDYDSIYDMISRIDYEPYQEFIENYKKDRERLLPLKIEEKKKILYENTINYHGSVEIRFFKKMYSLYDICNEYYDDEIILELVKFMLDNEVDPNFTRMLEDTFISKVISSKRSKDFIFNLFDISLKYNLDPNYINNKKLNYFEDIIINNKSKGKILPIYKLLFANGFKYDYDYEEIKKSIYNNKQYITDYEEFLKVLKYGNKSIDNIILNKDVEVPEGFNDDYLYSDNNKFNIVVGESEEIDNFFKNIKEYLTNKYNEDIISTNLDEIINNCISIGSLKNDLVTIIKDCVENNKVLMIKDIDKLYRENITNEEKIQIDALLLFYFEKKNLKIIATCDIENISLFTDSILQNYVNYIEIKERKNKKRSKRL